MMEIIVFLYGKHVPQNVPLDTWNLVQTFLPVMFQKKAGIGVSKSKSGKENVFSKRNKYQENFFLDLSKTVMPTRQIMFGKSPIFFAEY